MDQGWVQRLCPCCHARLRHSAGKQSCLGQTIHYFHSQQQQQDHKVPSSLCPSVPPDHTKARGSITIQHKVKLWFWVSSFILSSFEYFMLSNFIPWSCTLKCGEEGHFRQTLTSYLNLEGNKKMSLHNSLRRIIKKRVKNDWPCSSCF